MANKKHSANPILADAPCVRSPGRRAFMAFASATAGATVLGGLPGCGGGSDGSSTSTGSSGVAPASTTATDPIWGPGGSATQIINSLQGVAPSMFPAVDFNVTSFGAQAITSQVTAASAWS